MEASKLNLNTPILHPALPIYLLFLPGLTLLQAPVVVGKSLLPQQPAHTVWYIIKFLSKWLVPPSTCSALFGPP